MLVMLVMLVSETLASMHHSGQVPNFSACLSTITWPTFECETLSSNLEHASNNDNIYMDRSFDRLAVSKTLRQRLARCAMRAKMLDVPPAPHPGAVAKTAWPKAAGPSVWYGGYICLMSVKNLSSIVTGTRDTTAPPHPPPGSQYICLTATHQSDESPEIHILDTSLAAY